MVRRAGTEFPWTFLRRSVRPFHLATAVAMAVVGIDALIVEDTPLSNTGWGDLAGALAVIAALGLTISWLERSARLAESMLLIATGIWAYRAALYLLEGGRGQVAIWVNAFGLSIAWMIGTAGAYLLERYDRREREGVDE